MDKLAYSCIELNGLVIALCDAGHSMALLKPPGLLISNVRRHDDHLCNQQGRTRCAEARAQSMVYGERLEAAARLLLCVYSTCRAGLLVSVVSGQFLGRSTLGKFVHTESGSSGVCGIVTLRWAKCPRAAYSECSRYRARFFHRSGAGQTHSRARGIGSSTRMGKTSGLSGRDVAQENR